MDASTTRPPTAALNSGSIPIARRWPSHWRLRPACSSWPGDGRSRSERMTTAPTDAVTGRIPSVTAYSGYTVLCAALDGRIDDRRHGLFYYDTRILSRYHLTLDGATPDL